MPNHYLTVGICGRDYEAAEKLGIEDYYSIDLSPIINGTNLCEICVRLPDELVGIVATNPPVRYRHKVTGEWSKECNSPMGLDRDYWEKVELTSDEIASLRAKYGSCNWYDWNVENWGTKWGTYDTEVHQLGGDGAPLMISFQSAWGPPSPKAMRLITDYLCDTFCLKDFKWLGHDPYDNSTHHIEVAERESVAD